MRNNNELNRFLFPVLLSFILNIPCFAQSIPPFEWATNCYFHQNGPLSYANYGNAICTDDKANNYTLGYFGGTISFDTCTLNGTGSMNYFIVSHDSSGHFRWAKQITSPSASLTGSNDIVYDQAGNLYASGVFNGSISFDGVNYYNIGQSFGSFLARYDTSGNFQWVKIFKTSNTPSDWNVRLSSDNNHNIYVTGKYIDTLIVDGNIMNLPVTDNFYFAKYDSGGILQFMKSGFATNIINLRITHDVTENIYLSGTCNGNVNLQSNSINGKGLFIAGFDSGGNCKWLNLEPGNTVNSAEIHVVNNLLYVCGFYNDSLQMGTTSFYTPAITHNTFLAQFDTSGAFNWAKRMDVITGNQIRINGMAADDNYIYVAGEFTRSLNFNGIQYSSTTPNNSARDPYVAAYDIYGNEIWFKHAGSFHEDYGFGIDTDNDHNIYLTGSTHFPSYFDAVVINDSIGNAGGGNVTDTYIAKIDNSSILSMPELSSNASVKVCPNPMIFLTKIIFPNPHNCKFNFILYDMVGQAIENIHTEQSEIILIKGNKPAGIYMFKLTNGKTGEKMNGKIVVSD